MRLTDVFCTRQVAGQIVGFVFSKLPLKWVAGATLNRLWLT